MIILLFSQLIFLENLFNNTPLALLLILVTGIIGFVIAWYSKKSDTKTVIQNFAPQENFKGENSKLKKELKKIKDELNTETSSKNNWSEKYSLLETEYNSFKNDNADALNQMSDLRTESKGWESKYVKLQSDSEKWKKQVTEEKNQRKEIKSQYDSSQRDYNELKRKTTGQAAHISDLEEKIQALKNDSDDLARLKSENKKLITKSKKTEDELKYWEKQHYQTHHELTTLKDSSEGMKMSGIKLQATIDQLNMENKKLSSEVSEFKSKFMDINSKYQATWNKINSLEKVN